MQQVYKIKNVSANGSSMLQQILIGNIFILQLQRKYQC